MRRIGKIGLVILIAGIMVLGYGGLCKKDKDDDVVVGSSAPPQPPFSVIDAIGHLDNSGNPVYTRGASNDGTDASKLYNPQGIAIDEVNHRLFVADYDNNRVLVFNLNTDNTLPDRVADFVLGQPDFNSRELNMSPTQSNLRFPSGLAYDSTNQRLFVADTYERHRIMVFDVTEITNGEDAVNVLGQPDFTSSSLGGTTQSELHDPEGLVYDSTNNRLFVVDTSNHRIMIFDVATITDGENAANVLGQSNFTSNAYATTQSGLYYPGGLAYDESSSRLFVADYGNNRIMAFDVAAITDGEDAIGVLGQPDFVSNTNTTSQSGLGYPRGLSCDNVNNRLFAADRAHNRIMVFDVTTITNGEDAINVLGQSNFTISTSATTQSGLREPCALTYDNTNNRLFVTDMCNHRIMVFDVAAITDGENAVDTIGHLDSSGNPIYTKGGYNDFDGSVLNWPQGVVLDGANHRLFVADYYNSRVLVFNLNTDNTLPDRVADFVLGQTDFTSREGGNSYQYSISTPYSLAYDSDRNLLFAADDLYNRIMVFDVTEITNGEDAVNVLGQSDFTSNTEATTQNGFNGPRGLAYDNANNRLFVADGGNSRVMVFDVATITNGEDAINVLGQSDYTSYLFATTQNGLSVPEALTYDYGNNRLFVTDGYNNRVMVFDVATITNGEDAVNVLGQPDFTSNTEAATQDGFNVPGGLAYDAGNERLFVADILNHRVMFFDVATITNGENAIGVIGQDNFTSSTEATTMNGLYRPYGLDYDPTSQRLFIADMRNNRVMVYSIDF